MKKVKVEQAVGLELCHDITEMRDGFKGAVFKRGHIIEEADIPKLLDVGKRTIFVWEDKAGEIHEEDAALRMLAMAPIPHTYSRGPSEGKIVVFSRIQGMFRMNRDLLRQINSIGDLTICSLPDHYPVTEGQQLVSMRIVPLVTQESQIVEAEALCRDGKLFDLLPYQKRKVGVVITGSEIYSGRIQDKFAPVIRSKMSQYPSDIVGITICDDDLDMITAAAKEHLNRGADFLIFTGGMSVDPDDLTPTAIRALNAEIISHGVPSQPGNMTLVAYLGDIPILGVPGAAIMRPVTILDVLLPQIFAGEKLSHQNLINLAEGGLCQLCPDCHWPNCTFGRY